MGNIFQHYGRVTFTEWKHVEERLEKRLSSWKGKLLSVGGRLVLINSVLTNMVLYMLSFFQLPIKYLGIPIHYRRLTIAEWKHVEERLEKWLSSWKGKLLSVGGRLVLINFVLTNMILCILSFFQLSKGVPQRLEYFRS